MTLKTGGVLRVLGRTLETLQEGLGCENDRMWSAVEQTEEARMENRLWEARAKARGHPGRWRMVVALGVGGCPWTQEGCPPPRRRRDLVRYGLACAHSV